MKKEFRFLVWGVFFTMFFVACEDDGVGGFKNPEGLVGIEWRMEKANYLIQLNKSSEVVDLYKKGWSGSFLLNGTAENTESIQLRVDNVFGGKHLLFGQDNAIGLNGSKLNFRISTDTDTYKDYQYEGNYVFSNGQFEAQGEAFLIEDGAVSSAASISFNIDVDAPKVNMKANQEYALVYPQIAYLEFPLRLTLNDNNTFSGSILVEGDILGKCSGRWRASDKKITLTGDYGGSSSKRIAFKRSDLLYSVNENYLSIDEGITTESVLGIPKNDITSLKLRYFYKKADITQ